MNKFRFPISSVVWIGLLAMTAPAEAETVMQQCGQQYQAAKAAGTLNGMTWNQFRTDCAAKAKAEPADSSASPVAAGPASITAPSQPSAGAAPASSPVPVSGGRAAMLTREKQCGAEWRAQKASLVAASPGLTWPKYWSQCNTRLKAVTH